MLNLKKLAEKFSTHILGFMLGLLTGLTIALIILIIAPEQKTVAYHHGYRQAMMNMRDQVDHFKNYPYNETNKGKRPN